TSAIEQPHPGLRVTGARGDAFRRHGVDSREIALAQGDAGRPGVLFEPGALRRAGNRHDVVPPRQEPGQRQLRRRAALLPRDLLALADEVQALLKVRPLKPGRAATEVTRRQVVELLEPAWDRAGPERAVGNEADAKCPALRQDLVLRITAP